MKSLNEAQILIIEDEPLLLRLLEVIFGQEGFQVDTANDGQVAFQMISVKKYDVVLTDIQMPHLTGTELCHKIKSDPTLPQPDMWIALTAHIPDNHSKNFTLATFDESYFKPINPTLIAKMIKKWLLEKGYSPSSTF